MQFPELNKFLNNQKTANNSEINLISVQLFGLDYKPQLAYHPINILEGADKGQYLSLYIYLSIIYDLWLPIESRDCKAVSWFLLNTLFI
jgi:hypothetical protein